MTNSGAGRQVSQQRRFGSANKEVLEYIGLRQAYALDSTAADYGDFCEPCPFFECCVLVWTSYYSCRL